MPRFHKVDAGAFRNDGQPNAGRKPHIIPLIERIVRLVKRNPNKITSDELKNIVTALRVAADDLERLSP